jgi:Toprim domain
MKPQKQNPAALAGANGVGSRFQRDAGRQDHNARTLDLQHFPTILRAVLGEPNKAMSTKTALRYGESGGLSVNLTKGVFFDHKTGENGGMLALLVHLGHAKTTGEAAQWLRDQGYLSADYIAKSHEVAIKEAIQALDHEEARRRRNKNAARLIWETGQPLQGSPAQTYLIRRAIPEAAFAKCADLRFVPACPLHPYGKGGARHPALVARVVDRTGTAVGVHVTFLAPDGRGKAAIKHQRKFVGSGFSGACVRLGKGPHVVLAEGIESALSAGQALGLTPIAALSAGGVKSWRTFEGVNEVTFAPDNDNSRIGMESAQACAQRLHAQGIKVVGFAIPPGGVNDWNDAATAGLLDQDGGAS